MPQQSRAASAILPLSAPVARIEPPADLGPEAREIFLDVVGSVNPEHFGPEDRNLVASYCRVLLLERRAMCAAEQSFTAENVKNLARLSALALAHARRLRLGPLSRNPHKSRSARTPQPASYYERGAA